MRKDVQRRLASIEERSEKFDEDYKKLEAELRDVKSKMKLIVDSENKATDTDRLAEAALMEVTKAKDELAEANQKQMGLEVKLKEVSGESDRQLIRLIILSVV